MVTIHFLVPIWLWNMVLDMVRGLVQYMVQDILITHPEIMEITASMVRFV